MKGMKKAKTAAKPKKAPIKTAKQKATPSLQDFVVEALNADKAQKVTPIDLRGKTSIADFMIIATGTSSRHVAAMASKLRDKLNAERKIKARVEGADTGDWVIVDAGDVIVHLFREEVRAFYNLEKLWGGDFSATAYTRYQST